MMKETIAEMVKNQKHSYGYKIEKILRAFLGNSEGRSWRQVEDNIERAVSCIEEIYGEE